MEKEFEIFVDEVYATIDALRSECKRLEQAKSDIVECGEGYLKIEYPNADYWDDADTTLWYISVYRDDIGWLEPEDTCLYQEPFLYPDTKWDMMRKLAECYDLLTKEEI